MVSFYLLIYGNGTGTVANNTCAQLPPGFRPAKRLMLRGYADTSSPDFLYSVNTDGGIVFVRNFTTSSATWLIMSGTFPAGN
jgi:hypothetical protein